MEITIDTNNKSSMLEKKHFEEDINIDILNKLINSDLLQMEPWQVGEMQIENEKQQLLALKKLVKQNKLKVQYKLPKYGLGRVYATKSLSLGSLRKAIRHTLAYGVYSDIDVSNCHPEILNQLCINHKISTKYLNEYVNNRDEILKNTMDYYECSRDEAKGLFIMLMYYGNFNNWSINTDKSPTLFIFNFVEELKIISEKIIKFNPDVLKIVKSLQKKNEKGSVMSIILQQKERAILECIYSYLVKKNKIINNECVLCFDGIMIKKAKYSNNLLTELSEVVETELKFKLKFTEKEMDQHYLEELKDVIYEAPSIHNNSEYKELKNQFELQCFRLENPFVYVVKNSDDSIQLLSKDTLQTWSMKDFSAKFEDPEDASIKKNFIDVWLTDTKQKSYNKIVFDPSMKDLNNYNQFKGFKYTEGEQAQPDNIFCKLLRRVCNDDNVYNYFLNWIAHIIQHPYKKTNAAIVMYSNEKGVGKNCIVDGICKLLDGYNAHVETIEDITKNFNKHLVNKLFIYGDEIKASSKCISDKLKQVITRPTQNFEMKGKDAFEVADFTNWLFTTNNRDAFKVEQNDRRLYMIECIEQKLNMVASTEFYAYINDDVEMNKLFNYFKHFNITFNIGKEEPPMSRMKQELQHETKPAYIQMLYKQPRDFVNQCYTSNRFYEVSKEYATSKYLSHSYSITEFGRKINEILGRFKKRTNSGQCYDLSEISLNQLNKILFEHDAQYYRYINDLEQDFIPTFTNDNIVNPIDA